MAGISYLDFDLRIEVSGTGYRAQVQSSPVGQASAEFVKPFSDDELEIFILRVGRPRQGVRRLNSLEGQLAEKYGARLFEAVFGDEVYGCFRSSLTIAQKQDKGLRVRLRVDVPELSNLPWEYLYNPRLDRFLSLAVETPIVRYIELTEPIRALTVTPPLKVLAMISSPSDYPPLDVEEEWVRLSSALQPLTRRGQVTLERLEPATLAALQRRLRRGECHIFHFVGHGQFDEHKQDGVLLLERENNRGRPLSGQYLGTLLHNHRPLRLAILNACEGARTSQTDPFAGVAQSLVQQGIPAVIAMQFEITNKAAIVFAQTFYEALADGYPVDAALAEARMAIFAQENDIEWGTPVLFTRILDGRIFDMAEVQVERSPIPRVSPKVDEELEQLYTEGLGAFYTDEWEKACRSFRAIVDVRPDYKRAAAMLEDAERQWKLSTLYAQAQAALEAESWQEALFILEELATESPDYRDTTVLLEEARRQAQLAELYAQVRHLYQGEQWQAVINVFDRIHDIDPDYSDPENLLPIAEQQFAEQKRQAELSDLYGRALRAMGDRHWQKAHQLLTQVQEIEPDYQQVERLLARAATEIDGEEAERQQQEQIAALYRQAQELIHTQQWQQALSKMDEIHTLDAQFADPAGVADKARMGVKRQERLDTLYAQAQVAQEAEDWEEAISALEELVAEAGDYVDAAALLETAKTRKQLAALYAQARLLHQAGQWQDVVEVFSQIQAIEPEYADPQGLLPAAKREIAAVEREAKLDSLYTRAVKEVEAGRWREAQRLLVQVQGIEPGYREAEGLLTTVKARLLQPSQRQSVKEWFSQIERADWLLWAIWVLVNIVAWAGVGAIDETWASWWAWVGATEGTWVHARACSRGMLARAWTGFHGWVGARAWVGVGAVVGTAQWIVLRKRVHRSGWWVLANILVVAVGWTVDVAMFGVVLDAMFRAVNRAVRWATLVDWAATVVTAVAGGLGGAMGGAVVGTAQWIVLRKRVHRSGWWVLTNIVAVAVGRAVGWAATWAWAGTEAVGRAWVWAVGGAVAGAITGLVLIKLLQYPIPEAQDPQ